MSAVAQRANSWGYRPHLDGLRTLAVYLVVAFHSGSALFRGGFVGVDLFFVLSGFLVTNILLVDASSDGIRFSRFYARRARRLIPAAAVAVIGVSAVGVLVFNRVQRQNLIPDARASSLWYANWHFLAQSNDYFASTGVVSPLLHFWSLAIEEQFYLVLPLALFALIRVTKGKIATIAAVVAVACAVGVAIQLWWAGIDPNRAYLGTDARLYQPLVGVLLALVLWRWRMPTRTRVTGDLMFAGALAALIALAVTVPGAPASARGLLATLVSVVAILGGELSTSGLVARTLALKPIRYLGAISYGTYLWHWPIIAFGERLIEASSVATFVYSAALGTGLAALSYQILEHPVRTWSWLRAHSRASIAFGVATALIVGLVIAPWLLSSQRRPQMVPKALIAKAGITTGTPVPNLDWSAVKDDRPHLEPCQQPDASDCRLRQGSGPTVFLVGDSIAMMWTPVFMSLAEKYDWSLYLGHIYNCPWSVGIHRTDLPAQSVERCVVGRPRTYQQIAAVDPDLVVFAERGLRTDQPTTYTPSLPAYQGLEGAALAAASMTDTVDALPGDTKILFVEPVPEVAVDPIECLQQAEFVEQCDFSPVAETVEQSIYRKLAAEGPGRLSVSLDAQVCPSTCPAMDGDVVVRRDPTHLTSTYVRLLTANFDEAIAQLGVL